MRIVLELESGKENYYIDFNIIYLISHTIEQQHLRMNECLYNSLYYKILPVF